MICTNDPNYPQQNKRMQPAIVNRTCSVAKALSTIISIVFMQVSVPTENRSNMPLVD
jgi:hypothetical protein